DVRNRVVTVGYQLSPRARPRSPPLDSRAFRPLLPVQVLQSRFAAFAAASGAFALKLASDSRLLGLPILHPFHEWLLNSRVGAIASLGVRGETPIFRRRRPKCFPRSPRRIGRRQERAPRAQCRRAGRAAPSGA